MTLAELWTVILTLLRRPRRYPVGDWPDWTFGDPADLANHVTFVRFEPGYLTDPEQQDAARDVWAFLSRLPGTAVVTRRPDLYPAAYLTLTFGWRLGFTRDEFPPGGAAAVSPARCLQAFNDKWWHMDCLIDLTRTAPTRAARRAAAVHELGHAYGAPYDHPFPDESPGWWALVRRGPPLAAANARKFRLLSEADA